MDWLVDLESTCSALGTADGKEYVRDEQCEEGVKDLVRFVSFTAGLSFTHSCMSLINVDCVARPALDAWFFRSPQCCELNATNSLDLYPATIITCLSQLRRDDDNHEVRRRLGEIQVLQSDLVPLLKDSSTKREDAVLLDLVLRLVVNLTNPEILLFREELPEDKTARNFYLQLQSHRQASSNTFLYQSSSDSREGVLLIKNLFRPIRSHQDG